MQIEIVDHSLISEFNLKILSVSLQRGGLRRWHNLRGLCPSEAERWAGCLTTWFQLDRPLRDRQVSRGGQPPKNRLQGSTVVTLGPRKDRPRMKSFASFERTDRWNNDSFSFDARRRNSFPEPCGQFIVNFCIRHGITSPEYGTNHRTERTTRTSRSAHPREKRNIEYILSRRNLRIDMFGLTRHQRLNASSEKIIPQSSKSSNNYWIFVTNKRRVRLFLWRWGTVFDETTRTRFCNF